MKVVGRISLLLVLLLCVFLPIITISSAEASRKPSFERLKQLVEKAEIIKEQEAAVPMRKQGIKIQTSEQTKKRVVDFGNVLSDQEIAAYEHTYEVKFESKNSRKGRYMVTPNNEGKYTELLQEKRVEAASNDKPYKVSVQTVDWGLEKMNAPTAWNNPTPDTGVSVVIALIDTGVQLDHPELSGAILAGGHDYVNNDADPTDDQGHGTNMAGAIIAANNTEGPLGAAYGAKIIPYKVCDNLGQCGSIAISDAIDDAVAAHVDIINLSLGGTANDIIMQAVQNATAAGIIVVSAAGNENVEGCLFPAAYENVVCVGSTTNTDVKGSFSNFGPTLDVVTPGVGIYTTAMGSTYATVSGTSISTAYYSGAAALVESKLKALCLVEPSNVACADMRSYTQLLLNEVTVRDIGVPGKDSDFGNGIVDLSQIFTDTTTTHTAPTVLINKGTTYSQPITMTNNNSYQISLTSCTVMSKNLMRTQTVPAFQLTGLYQGATLYQTPTNNGMYTTFTFPTPIPLNAAGTANFAYSYLSSSETVTSDSIKYSFVCTYDKTSTVEVEQYRTEAASLTSTIGQPDVLKNVYFTFGKLRYNQTVSSSQLRALDIVYLKNYDPKKVKLTQFFLYDYAKHGNQGFTRTWRNSTSFSLRTNYLLAGHKKYAYVAEFQEISSGVKIKKYFVFYTR